MEDSADMAARSFAVMAGFPGNQKYRKKYGGENDRTQQQCPEFLSFCMHVSPSSLSFSGISPFVSKNENYFHLIRFPFSCQYENDSQFQIAGFVLLSLTAKPAPC